MGHPIVSSVVLIVQDYYQLPQQRMLPPLLNILTYILCLSPEQFVVYEPVLKCHLACHVVEMIEEAVMTEVEVVVVVDDEAGVMIMMIEEEVAEEEEATVVVVTGIP